MRKLGSIYGSIDTAMPFARLLLVLLATGGLSCGGAPSDPSSSCPTLPMKSSRFVNAGQTLRMTFTVPPTTGTDFLDTEIAYLPSAFSQVALDMSCKIFNGDVLLGNGACKENWQSSTAAF